MFSAHSINLKQSLNFFLISKVASLPGDVRNYAVYWCNFENIQPYKINKQNTALSIFHFKNYLAEMRWQCEICSGI